MRRAVSTWITVVACAVLAGCGAGREREAAEPSSGEPSAPAAPVLRPDGLRATSVYFSDADARRVVPVTRYVHPDSGIAEGAVRAMLAGPTYSDPDGITSAVPPGSLLLGINIRDSIATVDLTREFESGGGAASVRMRLAQLTYTLTRFPNVRRVRLHLEGKPVQVFSGEGLDVSKPLVRADFTDLTPWDEDPPVVVVEPVPGSTVTGPLRVRGTANVFEATVGLRVRDSSGKPILETFATATCGTGCRGTFEKTLALSDSVRGEIVVEAYAPSAKDGSDLHRVANRIHRTP